MTNRSISRGNNTINKITEDSMIAKIHFVFFIWISNPSNNEVRLKTIKM